MDNQPVYVSIKKRIAVSLLIAFGALLLAAMVFVFVRGAYDVYKFRPFPLTPGGMVIRAGCNPESAYYRQTIGTTDYYIPYAAYNQLLVVPRQRYDDTAYLGFSYPDLKLIIDDSKDANSIFNKIDLLIYNKKTKMGNDQFFKLQLESNKAVRQPELIDGWEFYTKPENINVGPRGRYGSDIYRDPDWKIKTNFAMCSHMTLGCTMYVEYGDLTYTINFVRPMLPNMKKIRDGVVAKVESYKQKPDSGYLLPEDFAGNSNYYKEQLCHN